MDYMGSVNYFHPSLDVEQNLEMNDLWTMPGEILDATLFSNDFSQSEDPPLDTTNGIDYLPYESPDEGWLGWMNAPAPELLPTPAGQEHGLLLSPNDRDVRSDLQLTNGPLSQQGFSNVTQWLDGSYCPPQPCSHCRRHRLQCLIIRTTPVNPNPVASCSSCAALFRECSLARGEKRQPSGFETLSPVMGHLHGVTELAEDEGDILEGSILPQESQDGSKESKQFVRRGIRILKEWFRENQDFPYPSEDEKVRLIRETGFSRKRMSTWFANARRRQKQRFEPPPLAQTCRSGSPMPMSRMQPMTPMERWQASPPEDEAVSESAIQNAISSAAGPSDSNVDPSQADADIFETFLNLEETSSLIGSSISSIGSQQSESSAGSLSSAWSYHSGEGALPFPLHPRPRTRHRRGRARVTSDEGQYQCTFCTRSFKKKHDWCRHEKSVHLRLDSWVCTPDINQLRPHDTQSACHFCDHPSQSKEHWDDHEFEVCAQKPAADRSFSRKDYLWQHLRKFHDCTKMPVNLDLWHGARGDVKSRCGFCDVTLPTWAARGDHLAEHFKDGYRMQEWIGDWGLDPHVLGELQNAVLPSQRSMSSSHNTISC